MVEGIYRVTEFACKDEKGSGAEAESRDMIITFARHAIAPKKQ